MSGKRVSVIDRMVALNVTSTETQNHLHPPLLLSLNVRNSKSFLSWCSVLTAPDISVPIFRQLSISDEEGNLQQNPRGREGIDTVCPKSVTATSQ